MPMLSTRYNSARVARDRHPVLQAFSRVYEPGTGSCLDEIHIWAQRVGVDRVEWLTNCVRTDNVDTFSATPICELFLEHLQLTQTYWIGLAYSS